MATENMDGALIDAAVAAGAKGIVIAGVGNGNMTKPARRRARPRRRRRASSACASSRVTTGQVGRNVEVERRQPGPRGVARTQPAEGARAAAARAAQDAGPQDDPAATSTNTDVIGRRWLTLGVAAAYSPRLAWCVAQDASAAARSSSATRATRTASRRHVGTWPKKFHIGTNEFNLGFTTLIIGGGYPAGLRQLQPGFRERRRVRPRAPGRRSATRGSSCRVCSTRSGRCRGRWGSCTTGRRRSG